MHSPVSVAISSIAVVASSGDFLAVKKDPKATTSVATNVATNKKKSCQCFAPTKNRSIQFIFPALAEPKGSPARQ
jgi:hypothetical protein